MPNNAELFPSDELQHPGPVITPTRAEEWEVEKILDKRTRGHGCQYLIHWHGYGPEADMWVPGQELEGTSILQDYDTMRTNENIAALLQKQLPTHTRSDEMVMKH
jgi:hypothetical protein